MKKTHILGQLLAIPFLFIAVNTQAAPVIIQDTSLNPKSLQNQPTITPGDIKVNGGTIMTISPVGGATTKAKKGTSTRLVPLNPNNATVKYPGQTVLSPNVTSEQFGALPVCPNQIVCPDINSTSPPNPFLCPDYCTKTRVVNPASGTPPIISTISAVCPQGYAQVASYNTQREIIHDTSRSPDVQIASLAELADYKSAGWLCSLNYAAPTQTTQICSATDPSYQLNADLMIGAYAGQYTSKTIWQCYLPLVHTYVTPGKPLNSDGNCVDWVDCSQYDYTRKIELEHGQTLPPAEKIYTYIYSHYTCSPPANGLFYTDRYAPASIVCARVKQEWQQLKPDTNLDNAEGEDTGPNLGGPGAEDTNPNLGGPGGVDTNPNLGNPSGIDTH